MLRSLDRDNGGQRAPTDSAVAGANGRTSLANPWARMSSWLSAFTSSTTSPVSSGGYIPALDGLRAISVMIVAISHAGFTSIPGGFGVSVFFFLSGFLITTLLLGEHAKTGTIDIRQFYIRRFLRLMPPLLVTLAVAYGLFFLGVIDGAVSWAGLASQVFYFANYFSIFMDGGNHIPAGTGVLWSLAVEEHFYIIFPVLMLVLLQKSKDRRLIAGVLGAVCIAVLLWRFYLVGSPGFIAERTYYATDTRVDSIIFGCILALAFNPLDAKAPQRMTWMHWLVMALALGTLMATFLVRNGVFRETVRYTLQGLALMPLFYCAIRWSNQLPFAWLNTKWLMVLGTYSYAIYLIHHVAIMALTQNIPQLTGRPLLTFFFAMTLAIGFAALIDKYVDPYFRMLRQRYRPH